MDMIEKFKIPLCQPQRIPIKMLIEQLDAPSTDAKLIQKHISSLRLVSILDENTIKMRSFKDDDYSFQSIYIIYIELKKDDSIVSLSNIVHSAFPEPTLLIFKYKDIYYISTANKRINKVNVEKCVIEDTEVAKLTPSIDELYLDLSIITGSNLKEYYEDIVKWLYKLKVFHLTNVFPQTKLDYKKLVKEYDIITQEINKLKDRYKLASMVAEKVKIDDELYDKENLQKSLISKLKGDQENG